MNRDNKHTRFAFTLRKQHEALAAIEQIDGRREQHRVILLRAYTEQWPSVHNDAAHIQ